jgi:hypothetical protein
MKTGFFAVLTMVLIVLGLCLIGVVFNPHGFWSFWGDLHDGLGQMLHAIGMGIVIIFSTGLFCALLVGGAYAYVKIKHLNKVQTIGPTKFGAQQAVVVYGVHGPQVEHLSNNQMPFDMGQVMQIIEKTMRANTAAVAMMQKATAYADRVAIQEEKPDTKQIASPSDAIPAVVTYSEVSEQVPTELSLLGIHPTSGALEIVSPTQLKTAWFVGGSNMGKTNTVYGKVADMMRWHAQMIICDNHADKPDSLANKLRDFHHRLLIPIAQADEDIKRAIIKFLKEFHQRRDHGRSIAEMWLIVCDEVNATGNHVVKLTEQEEQWLYDAYGIKVEDHRVKLMVFFKILAETCGYEARGFGMFGFFISQKVAGLAWLRNAMMTVFVHGLLMYSEALLAANQNRARAEEIMKFKKGRTLIYGYELDEMVLQQPLYEPNTVESTVSEVVSTGISELSPVPSDGDAYEYTVDQPGKQSDTETIPTLSQAQKMKLLQVLEMDSQQKGQNHIIRTIWGVEPNTRAGSDAAEELRLIRAYIAGEQRRKLGL